MPARILLAAIAKNEAAYIPEWIFYHLRLGIDNILIYVNNTTDNTVAVLEKIALNHPVKFEIVDGIVKEQHPLFQQLISNPEYLAKHTQQSKSYARILARHREEYDYILIIDIDEFLVEQTKDLRLLLQEHPGTGVFYFSWFNLTGDDAPFQLLVKSNRGQYNPWQKFLISTAYTSITLHSAHEVNTHDTCEAWNDPRRVSPKTRDKSIVVAHRYHRSLPEYIAMLRRGNTTDTRVIDGFKYNRTGWTNKAEQSIGFKSLPFTNYESDYKHFLESNNIADDVVQAQAFIKAEYEQVKAHLKQLSQLNEVLSRTLRGTGINHQFIRPIAHQLWLKLPLRTRKVLLRLKQTVAPRSVSRK